MAKNSLEVRVPTLVRGMEQINREKAEIKLVLQCLMKPFRHIALQQKEGEEVVALRIEDGKGDSLLLETLHNHRGYWVSLLLVNEDEGELCELVGDDGLNPRVGAEGLSAMDTYTVHALLQPLVDKVRELLVEDFDEMFSTFIDAAARAPR